MLSQQQQQQLQLRNLLARQQEQQWQQAEQQRQQAEQQRQQAEQQRQQAEQQRVLATVEAQEQERNLEKLEEDGVVVDDLEGDPDRAELLEQETAAVEEQQSGKLVFAQYVPRKVTLGRKHPDAIVESSAMASVEPPDATYTPALPTSLLEGAAGAKLPDGSWGAHAERAAASSHRSAAASCSPSPVDRPLRRAASSSAASSHASTRRSARSRSRSATSA